MALMNKNNIMGLSNLISDAYLESFNTPTFQKAIYFDKSDYILTASGNKVSKHSILCGMKNIHMLGKSIIKNEAILRGDLNNLYFGKYVIVGSKTLICPCFLSSEDSETDETTVSNDIHLSEGKKMSTTAEEEEDDEEDEEVKENGQADEEEQEETEDVEGEIEKKKKTKKLHSKKFQTYNKQENDSDTNNTTVVKKTEKNKCEYSYLTVTIGDNVYIGNDCIVKAAFIGNNVLIGDNCVIGERVIIKDNVIIEDNTIVPNDIVIAPFSKYSGCPAKFVKELPESAEMFLKDYSYMQYKKFLTKKN